VLWRCWLSDSRGIRPVKKWVVGCWRGCLSGAFADLHIAQLMPLPLTVSCFSKIQIGFTVTFFVLAYWCSPGQRGVKQVFVCSRDRLIVNTAIRQLLCSAWCYHIALRIQVDVSILPQSCTGEHRTRCFCVMPWWQMVRACAFNWPAERRSRQTWCWLL